MSSLGLNQTNLPSSQGGASASGQSSTRRKSAMAEHNKAAKAIQEQYLLSLI